MSLDKKFGTTQIAHILKQQPNSMVVVYSSACSHCHSMVKTIESKYKLNPTGATVFPNENIALLEGRTIVPGTVAAYPSVIQLDSKGGLSISHDTSVVLKRFAK
jgi:hypothetical protein